MGCFDVYCFICGLPSLVEHYYPELFDELEDTHGSDFVKRLKSLLKKLSHLEKCTILTKNDKVIHHCKEYNCSGGFKDSRGHLYDHDPYGLYYNIITAVSNRGKESGIFIHTSCWNFIKKEYKIELKYSDLPILIHKSKPDMDFSTPIRGIKYGAISKYWEQYFDFIGLALDNNEWMALSLSTKSNAKNINRVKKIFSQMKIRYEKGRKSPNSSASFYPDKTIKIGKDSNFWTKSKGKWVKIADEPVKMEIKFSLSNKKHTNMIKSLRWISSYSDKPLFIYSLEYISKKKEFTVGIILSKKYSTQLKLLQNAR